MSGSQRSVPQINVNSLELEGNVMKAKNICLILLSAVLMIVLAGCSGESQITDTQTPETTASPINAPMSMVVGTQPDNSPSSGDDGDTIKGQDGGKRDGQSEIDNWRELYDIPNPDGAG